MSRRRIAFTITFGLISLLEAGRCWADSLWRVDGGRGTISFASDSFAQFGLSVARADNPNDVRSFYGAPATIASDSSMRLTARGLLLQGSPVGAVVLDTGVVFRSRESEVTVSRWALSVVRDGNQDRFVLADADAPDSDVLLEVSSARSSFDSISQRFMMESADVMIAPWLADALDTPGAAGAVVGAIQLKADLVWAGGDDPADDRPFTTEDETQTDGAGSDVGTVAGTTPGNNGTVCGAPTGPDVIVGDLSDVTNYANVGGIDAFAVGTTSCNIGDQVLLWDGTSNQHPIIGQNLFRLKNDRFEQIGQSWLKHGFTALQQDVCGCGCIAHPDGTRLGVGCSDPYCCGLNGSQSGLGPKFEVNPYTGAFIDPHGLEGITGNSIFKRLQAQASDLDPALNAGALYFVEAQYIAPDDAAAGNGLNNASYRRVTFSGGPSNWSIALALTTQREQPGIRAWKDADATVSEVDVPVLSDGMFIAAAKSAYVGGGFFRYEYAVQNLNSDRAAVSFSVPIDPTAVVQNVGFHDVDYHSGEPYAGTDWPGGIAGSDVAWSTESFATNANANALRWGTLYNFRFETNRVPVTVNVMIGLFKPGSPGSVSASIIGPSGAPPECLTDPECDDSNPCTADSCVALVCQHIPVTNGTSCADGDPCNGAETCQAGVCTAGTPPPNCCTTPAQCIDGNACNGVELCVSNVCTAGTPLNCDDSNDCTIDTCNPLPGCLHANAIAGTTCGSQTDTECDNPNTCDGAGSCVDNFEPAFTACGSGADTNCDNPDGCSGAGACLLNNEPDGTPCPDSLTCNGLETCQGAACSPGTPVPSCCDFDAECVDGTVCNGGETCVNNSCVAGTPLNCDDGDACTSDSCHPTLGCQYAPITCNDGNTCTSDSCNPGTGCVFTDLIAGTSCGSPADTNCDNPDSCDGVGTCVVNHEPNGTSCADALVCNGTETCQAGVCTAGTPIPGCCKIDAECSNNNACDGVETCVSNTCQPGAAPNCNDANDCTIDSCSPALGCQHVDVASGTPCGNPSDTTCDHADTCDGAGTCQANVMPDGVLCLDALVCNGSETCLGGLCVAGTPLPNCCDFDAQCDDGDPCNGVELCVSNVCVNGAPLNCNDGNECTADSCTTGVGCQHVNLSAGTACGSPIDSNCDDPDTCNGGAGICLTNHTANGTPCPDGQLCNGDESCLAGVCAAGTPVPGCCTLDSQCDDANLCNGLETCDSNECRGGTALNCDDTNACTIDACGPAVGCINTNSAAGTLCGSSSDNSCDNPDTCNGAGTCVTNNEANGTPCPDGVLCNGNETCQAGVCAAGTPLPGCCKGNADCTDNNVCNGLETCVGNTCVNGPALVCPTDSNVCTDNVCNPTLGCQVLFNSAPCSDGNPCTTTDTCAFGICIPGPANPCSDGNPCTNDSCNTVVGCLNSFNTFPCNDGNLCTLGDRCTIGVCVGLLALPCSDGNPCTNDGCSPASGCVYVNNSSACDDGDACTISDVCSGGVCAGAGANDCDDGSPCTLDTCDSGLGCIHTVLTGACDDGSICTENDVCNDGLCGGTPAFNCNDGNPCTDDSCHPQTGCVNASRTGPCDDGLFCTVTDECINGVCVGANNPCPDPGSCDNETQTCGGCLPAVQVLGVGARYIAIDLPPGTTPVGILVVGASTDPDVNCVAKYAQANMMLGTNVVMQTPAAWGRVFARGVEIIPLTTYDVYLACGSPANPVLSTPLSGTTWRWGDITNENGVDNIDIIYSLNGFQGIFNGTTKYAVDLAGSAICAPVDYAIDNLDIIGVLNAFQGAPYPCAAPCP